jgi:DNA polymerase-3 subunit alpha
MLIAAIVAGHTLADGDVLRRAVQKRGGALPDEERRFFAGADARGVRPSISRRIFSRLVEAGPLTFNRSHAVSCALVSYCAAHLLTHGVLPPPRS